MQSRGRPTILLVTPLLPVAGSPFATGGSIFIFNLIRRLAADHDVYLICRASHEERTYVPSLRGFCKEIHVFDKKRISPKLLLHQLRYWHLHPANLFYYFEPDIVPKMREIVTKVAIDVLQFEFVSTGQYIRHVTHPCKVLDEHDVRFAAYRLKYKAERKNLLRKTLAYLRYRLSRKCELDFASRAHLIFTRSEEDKGELLACNQELDVELLPHGVGLTRQTRTTLFERPSVLFVGNFAHAPNIDAVLFFVRSILPTLSRLVPEIRFYVVGGNAPPSIKDLETENITVVGYAEDTDEYLSRCHVFVAPITWGAGVRVKILEAMASGAPVVTTSIGGYGVKAANGTDFLVEDDPLEFAAKVASLIRNPQYAEEIGASGRRLVAEYYNWDKIYSDYNSLLSRYGRHRG